MVVPLQILQVLTREYGKRESGRLGDQLFIPKRVASSLPKPSVVLYVQIHPISIAGWFGLELWQQRVRAFYSEGRHCGQAVLQLAALCTDLLNLRIQQLQVLWKRSVTFVLILWRERVQCQHKPPFPMAGLQSTQ